MADLLPEIVRGVVETNLRSGLKLKDISDWIKILVLLGSMIAGYVSLRDQVAGHTQQIGNVQEEIGKMRQENRLRNNSVQQQLGSIDMYLCSKDSTHCTIPPTPEPEP